MKKQAVNPFLPINEYIPDGEPHVFGDRVYHYGSHDKEGGYTFCMLDYVCYSAPVNDLTDWRYEGVIYRAKNDPDYDIQPYMYAPDVVQGNDGKYYLFYCTAGDYGYEGYKGPIKVAVCDTPAGEYTYLGKVKYKDGTIMERYVCFDPGVINDDGVIRVYYGTQYDFEEQPGFRENDALIQEEMNMFGKTREEIFSYDDCIMGPVMLTLEDDMLTVKDEPKHIIPYKVKGTSFEKHPFFEASSMRKVGNKYYFIYSSWENHELCYAVSDKPDGDFVYGGTIVSNADVGYQGRDIKNKLNMTGTTHGSIIEINGQWYVFYHRLTHKSDYSRQACAEKIMIMPDGSIPQVNITSCGLNKTSLKCNETYPAGIACNITNGHMPHGCNSIFAISFPNVTHRDEDRFVGEISNGTVLGYKYFDFKTSDYEAEKKIGFEIRLDTEATRAVYEGPIRLDGRSDEWLKQEEAEKEERLKELKAASDDSFMTVKAYVLPKSENSSADEILPSNATQIACFRFDENSLSEKWMSVCENVTFDDGEYALYFSFSGSGMVQVRNIYV